MAWDHDLCRAVVATYMRAVLGWLRRRARLDEVADGRGGAVAIVQRFGGALNLNVHIHALVLDGVFAKDRAGALAFHPVACLTALDLAEVLATVEPRITRLLERRGLGDRDESAGEADAWLDDTPVLAGLAAASVPGTAALGRQRGARIPRLGRRSSEEVEPPTLGQCHARSNGFDLHAGLVVPTGQRDRLERLCRYVLRPPVAQERVFLTAEGDVHLRLRRPWADGTTRLVFNPLEFLGRLAVLVPRPRINLILYHGVLGPRAAWRAEVVRRQPSMDDGDAEMKDSATEQAGEANPAETARRHARGQRWASLIARTFGFDVLACPRCGGHLRLIALIEEGTVVERILRHLGLPTEIPSPRPARAPPIRVGSPSQAGWDDGTSVFDPCS